MFTETETAAANAQHCNAILSGKEALALGVILDAFTGNTLAAMIETVFEMFGYPRGPVNEFDLDADGQIVWRAYQVYLGEIVA